MSLSGKPSLNQTVWLLNDGFCHKSLLNISGCDRHWPRSWLSWHLNRHEMEGDDPVFTLRKVKGVVLVPKASAFPLLEVTDAAGWSRGSG